MPLFRLVLAVALTACAGNPRLDRIHRTRLDLAEQLVERRSWSDALAELQRYHAHAPPTAESLTLRGIALRERGVYDEARADLERAVRLDRNHAPAHAALAMLLDLQSRWAEAEPHHMRAIELQPRNPRHWNDLGYAAFSRGRTDDAIMAYRRALELEPTFRRARTNLGFAYARARDFARAAQQFELAEPPAEARNNLGVAYEAAGLFAPAYDSYLAAVRLDPGLGRARSNLIAVAKASGRALPPDVTGEPAAGER